jgi:putative transposase
MSVVNRLWGQRRVQAELVRLGFPVSARTVSKYMRRPYDGVPSPTWRKFLTDHAKNIWACDFFGVRTVFFRTLYVFFVMHHETRQILQVQVTRHPTADWAAQQAWTPVPGIGIRRGISSVTGTAGTAKRLIGACEDSG